MKLEVIGNKIKICGKKFDYKKEVKSIYNSLPFSRENPKFTPIKLAEREIYNIKYINDTIAAKELFKNNTNIIIGNKKFYCSADLKTFNCIDYFMEDVKLIEC